MRHIMLVLLFLSALTAAVAQADTLLLSRANLVVKITDPARQLKTFTPVLDMLNGMLAYKKSAKDESPISILRQDLEKTVEIPGVDAKGDFWIVVMLAPSAAKAVSPLHTAKGVKKALSIDFLRYMLVPLVDQTAFAQYLRDNKLPGAVCSNYGIMTDVPSNPLYQAIKFDVTLHTKREIALALLHGEEVLSLASKSLQSLDTLPLGENPLRTVDVRQVDVGLKMAGDDLSLEYYLVPTKNGVLEKGLLRADGFGMAQELAGYLPANLAYCSASGPIMDGAPGVTRVVFELATAFLVSILPAKMGEHFADCMKALISQCSQGRAMGLTAPAEPEKSPTLVAVYHIVNARKAKHAVRQFIAQVQQVRTTALEGVLSPQCTVALRPAAEMVSGTPVDVVKIEMNCIAKLKGNGGMSLMGRSLHFLCRVAYLRDKMLFTAGDDSQAQMAALLDRINNHTAGFTASAQYRSLKDLLPDYSYSFTSFATHDLANALAKLLSLDQYGDLTQTAGKLRINQLQLAYNSAAAPIKSWVFGREFQSMLCNHAPCYFAGQPTFEDNVRPNWSVYSFSGIAGMNLKGFTLWGDTMSLYGHPSIAGTSARLVNTNLDIRRPGAAELKAAGLDLTGFISGELVVKNAALGHDRTGKDYASTRGIAINIPGKPGNLIEYYPTYSNLAFEKAANWQRFMTYLEKID